MHEVIVAFILLSVWVERGDLLVEREVLFGGVSDKQIFSCNGLPVPYLLIPAIFVLCFSFLQTFVALARSIRMLVTLL